MATVHMIFRDTVDGLVEVETTVTDWDEKSSAIALADRVNGFMAEVADEKQAPTPIQPETPKLQLVTH